jgi:hypothetical protein
MRSIILVEKGEGQWEDYQRWVERAYEVETTKTGDELEREWKAHVVLLMEAEGIDVNPHHLNVMIHSEVQNKKLHRKILKGNGFCAWLEHSYGAKAVEFKTVMPTQI